MRAFSLILFLAIVLSTQALKSQRKLIARCTEDDNPQLSRGEVSISRITVSCSEAIQSVKKSCDKNDTVELEQSVYSVKASVTQLKTVVETFDGQLASTHKTTVVEIFSSYFSIVDTISKSPDRNQVCQEQLVQINEAFLSISSVFIAYGIDLSSECKSHPNYNEAAFQQLHLRPPFTETSSSPADSAENLTAQGDQTTVTDEQANSNDQYDD